MLHGRWIAGRLGRVNPLVSVLVALAGPVAFVLGFRWVGVGIAIGACMALFNAVLLSRRVDLAAKMSTVATALLFMQLSLLVTATIIGIATVILVRISLAMAVAFAAGFGVSHVAILAEFYWTKARTDTPLEV
jgi:hypothetical protein